MSKKGISPLIATVLLIGATIALAALVMIWAQNLFQETTEETGSGIKAEIICSSQVQFNINSATGTTTPTTVRVTNNGERKIITFIARVYDGNGNIERASKVTGDELEGYGSKTYSIEYSTGTTAEKIELIPVVELDDGSEKTCGQNTVTRAVV